jgi:hypothetical protein
MAPDQVAKRGVVDRELGGDLRDRPAGGEHQVDRITFEFVRELPAPPWLSSLIVVPRADVRCQADRSSEANVTGIWSIGQGGG